jgi:hypothetical protein
MWSHGSVQDKPNESVNVPVCLTIHNDLMIYNWSLSRWRKCRIGQSHRMSSMNQKASFRSGAGSYLLYYWPLFRKSLTRLLILFDLSIHRKLLWCPLPISYWAVPFPNTFVLQLHWSILAEKDVAAIFRVRHAVPYCRRWQQCFC